jgi:hypothetical protein
MPAVPGKAGLVTRPVRVRDVGFVWRNGAGIGVGIDAMIRGQQTIFRRPVAAAVSLRF